MRGEATGRLQALDLLRGTAVAGMILVTSPGRWEFAYAQLRHADWNGWTAADMVFPAFLFGVGVALGLSFPRPLATPGATGLYWRRIGRRVAALILLGLALEATYNLAIGLGAPFMGKAGLANIRLPGILQRIALCYALAAGLLFATARRGPDGLFHIDARAVVVAIGAILIGYWALLRFVPVPGYGAGGLDPDNNLAGYIDRAVFTVPHLWPFGWGYNGGAPVYDPEGLLSTLPAATDTLFGILAGMVWRRSPGRAPLIVAGTGALLVFAGLALDPLFVINKRIFTSSFALLSSGIAALALAGFAWLVRSDGVLRLLTPLRVLGGNAILAFILATLLGRLYGFPLITEGSAKIAPQLWLDQVAMRVVPDPYLASLICAVGMVALVTALLWPLHRRALYFRL